MKQRSPWMFWVALFTAGAPALFAPTAHAGTGCPEEFKTVGECFAARGRPSISASLRARIWRIGTKRIVQVEPVGDRSELPDDLTEVFKRDIGAIVFGNFELCPLTPNVAGRMQFACMKSASSLTVVSRRED
jgi:hypothetical protein